MFRRANALVIVFLLLAAIGPAGSARAADVVVTSVTVPDANQVLIKANATFTAKASPSGALLINVDVKKATLGDGVQPVVAGQGIIKDVQVKALEGQNTVRVSINLSQEATVEAKASEGALVINLTPKAGGAAVEPEEVILPYEETRAEVERLMTGTPPPKFDPIPDDYMPVQVQTTGALPPILTPMPPPGPNGAATVVGDIYYRTLPDGVQILIMTNGVVGAFTDYDTRSPAMLYVEFPGLSSTAPQRVYNLRWGGVNDITVTKKSGGVAVAIDFARGLQAYNVQRTQSGVVVTVYKAKYVPGGMGSTRYVTQSGESLASVSQKIYGSPEGWKRIYSANRDAFTRRERAAIEKSNGNVQLGAGVVLMVPNR